MTQRVLGPTGSPRRRWSLLVGLTIAISLGLFYVAGAQAVHSETPDLFELEGDATADLVSTKVGVLQSSISAGDLSANVCQSVTDTIAAPPFQAIIDFEKINVTASANGNFGGSCPSPNVKKTYTIQRAQAGTTAASHSGSADVTKLVAGSTGDGAGDDWSNLFPSGTSVNPSNFDGKTFVNDKIGTDADATYFTGGGSKDRNDVSQWQWTLNDQSPDKNDIVNAFASAYHIGSRHLLYFGADRYQVGGDAQMAFWFLAGETCLAGQPLPGGGTCPNTNPGKFVNPATGAVATHTIGDILAVVNFNNGGAIGLAGVYRWNGTEPESVIQGNNADCTTIGAGDDFCTVSNKSLLTFDPTGWHNLYKGKLGGSDVNYYQTSAFIEGGIDLSAIAGAATCFPTFVAETRSSSGPDTGLSLDSQLKDLAFGQFQQCGSTLQTTPKQSDGTTNIPSDGVSLGSNGQVQVKDSAALTVSGISTWSGTMKFFLCGPIANNATCGSGGLQIGSDIAVDQGTTSPIVSAAAILTSAANNTTGAPGRYCFRGEFDSNTTGVPDQTDSSANECFYVKPVKPTLDTDAGDGPVDFGQAITDTATLSGTVPRPAANGSNATYPSIFNVGQTPVQAAAGGTITFFLYGPDSCTTLATNFPAAGIARGVSGNGTYPKTGPPDNQAAVSFVPAAPGKYTWKATYGGDNPNTLASDDHNTNCDDTDEDVVVSQIPTVTSTRQWVVPQDKAKIDTNPTGGTLAGNVTFKLFDTSANCTANGDTVGQGGLLYKSGALPISGAGPQFATTSNTAAVTTNTTVYWRVTYVSTNQAQLGSSSVCTEQTTVSFAGNDASITVP